MSTQTANNASWRIGKILDARYEILSVVGIGGMAVVYKAYDSRLRRNVAIKVLRDDTALDDDSRRRFRTEYQAVAILNHPNIRAVYDVVSSGVTEYIVMEYVDGINLKEYLGQKQGGLPWREALVFTTQIARALRHAHSRGIVHMDIKPQNIMLPKDGVAKVADFGIAQLEETAGVGTENQAVGSIHYISPEQARGEPIDARTDIFSLGVVMYEMLTGRLPFEGDTLEDVALKHFAVPPRRPSEIYPGIPKELEEITMKALQPDPSERYSSADEMLVALDDFRKNHPDSSAPATVPEETVQPDVPHTRRRQVPAAPDKDQIHIIKKNVPRISNVGELDYTSYQRRRMRSNQVSSLLGYSIVLVFIVLAFSFLWSYWLKDIFSDAERTTVPKFTGYYVDEITENESMTSLFRFTTTYQADAEYPEGTIIGQSPEAGSSRMIVENGILVNLVVSSGVQMITLPETVNTDYAAAQQQLLGLGLEVVVELEASDSVSAGRVLRMDPASGSSVANGTVITLTVSAGPSVTYTTVPQLVGMSKAQALLTLQRSGLKCTEEEITYVESTDAENGMVLWQSYDEGTTVITGTTIYLQIGTGPEAE